MPTGDHTNAELERQLASAKRTLELLFPAARVTATLEGDAIKVEVELDDEAAEDASTEAGLERLVDAMIERGGRL